MAQTMKQALAQALKELLENRTIDKITVKDIVERCGVNRQSFYYHFRDIYDLMEWSLMEDIEQYTSQLAGERHWKERVRRIFHLLLSNRKVILHSYNSVNRIQYEQFLRKWIRPIFRQMIQSVAQKVPAPEEKQEFLADIFTWGCTGLLLDWLEQGMPDGYQIHLEDYFVLFDNSIEQALVKFQTQTERENGSTR